MTFFLRFSRIPRHEESLQDYKDTCSSLSPSLLHNSLILFVHVSVLYLFSYFPPASFLFTCIIIVIEKLRVPCFIRLILQCHVNVFQCLPDVVCQRSLRNRCRFLPQLLHPETQFTCSSILRHKQNERQLRLLTLRHFFLLFLKISHQSLWGKLDESV